MATQHDQTRALTHREQARDKLPIFFGSRDNFLHPLRELTANATDEMNKHFESGVFEITHMINDGESMIKVVDTGRGLPIGENDINGNSNIETLLLTLFGGGKYDDNAGQIGTNGVGLTVTNYTSKHFKVESAYDGVLHTVTFSNGGENQKYTTKKISSKKHFTSIEYVLDKDVYTNTKYSDDEINDWIHKVSAVAPKIKFKFTNSQNEVMEYNFPTVESYFDDLVNSQSTSATMKYKSDDNGVIEIKTPDETNTYQVLFTSQAEPVHQVFLNGNPLSEYSVLDSGIVAGIRIWFEKYYEGKRKVKPFTNQDIEDSLSYVINVVSSNAEFNNQTKLSTEKRLYQAQVKKVVQKIMDEFRENHAVYFNRFEKHLQQVQNNNEKNSNSKKKLMKKLNEGVDGIKGRVEDFIDSRRHGEEAELFLTEGQSALGSIVLARDSEYQAAFPLRGKVLNVEKASMTDLLNNKEITNVLKIIGGGMGKDFNIDETRFGKIVISTDQDDDGFQIQVLLLTLFNKVAQPLIKSGKVFIAKTPLYIIHFTDSDDVQYIESEAEMAKVRSKLKNVKTIARVKGLGELDAKTMRETAMNPETRQLTQVTMEDVDKAQEMIDNWMGKDPQYRKEYISEHLLDLLLEEG